MIKINLNILKGILILLGITGITLILMLGLTFPRIASTPIGTILGLFGLAIHAVFIYVGVKIKNDTK